MTSKKEPKKISADLPAIVQKDTAEGKKVLRAISKEIKPSEITNPKIQKIISDMKKSLATQADGVALAAPQIGINLRLFVINPKVYTLIDMDLVKQVGTKNLELVFINPEIIKMSKDRKTMDEGCLSVRPWYGKVKRASRARVHAFNEKGESFELEASGLLAQIFQHETDHLDGILFVDKAKNLRELPAELFENY